MEYSKLVNIVEKNKTIKTMFNVISFLIGYQGFVDENDYDNIIHLYQDGFINK